MRYFSSIIWVVCENHGLPQVKDLPSHQLLASRGAVLTNYFSVTHPSGPNYRSMAAGDFWTHDEILAKEKPTIVTQTRVEAVVWSFKGPPAARHNPLADLKSAHSKTSQLDLESLPDSCILYVGMDDKNNAHSGPLAVADQNLLELIGRLDRSTWFQRPVNGRYPALFVTWDEAYGGNNQVFAAFFGLGVQASATSNVKHSHFSFCRLVTDNWEQPPLQQAANVNPIDDIWI